jgi:Tfp pilus assembly PilM family ATPase
MMALVTDRIKSYFMRQLLPRSAIQLTSSYLSGIHVSSKEGKIKNHFILPLEKGIIQPSFSNKNIKNPALLEKKIKQGLEKLHLSDNKIACLIPEVSLKAFVFSFDSLPSSREQRERIIRFRVKKQIPLLPDDARFSFDRLRSNSSAKIFVTVARASIIQEYEDLFSKLHLKVRALGVPTLSLYYLLNKEEERDLLLINIEEDSLSLIAGLNSEVAVYRLKLFIPGSLTSFSGLQRVENIVKEVENTVNFVEDKEKKKVNSFRIRLGLLEPEEEMFSQLKEKLSLPAKGIEAGLTSKLGLREKVILSPLIGQIL